MRWSEAGAKVKLDVLSSRCTTQLFFDGITTWIIWMLVVSLFNALKVDLLLYVELFSVTSMARFLSKSSATYCSGFRTELWLKCRLSFIRRSNVDVIFLGDSFVYLNCSILLFETMHTELA